MRVQGQERLDGLEVMRWLARFSGTVELSEDDADHMGIGKGVIVVAWARVAAPSFKETADGDLARVDVLKPEEIAVVTGELRDQCFELLSFGAAPGQERLSMPPPPEPTAAPPAVDPETGEIETSNGDAPTPDPIEAIRDVVQDDGELAGPQPGDGELVAGDTTQQLGSVYDGRRRDQTLARFLES